MPAVAEAVTVVAVLSESTDPSAGAEIETVGAAALTVTLTADEVTVVPAESVARAVNATVPTALGVQVVVYGEDVTAAPTWVPLAKKVTDEIVAPPIGVALAVNATPVPTVAVEPLDGAVNDTAVPASAVTAMPPEVTVVPAESVTLAVSV